MNERSEDVCSTFPRTWRPDSLALRIIDRHDLWDRSDCEHSAMVVLLTDAAFLLTEVSAAVFREQAATDESVQTAKQVMQMVQDAIVLAALSPSEPVPGAVTSLPDRTLQWAPISPEPA